ncbi:MAG: Stk1 family PASTA domain-containing Ser/Thr kinase [Micrococcales bacterium]
MTERLIAGRYELGSLIGRGGMADVYEGKDTRLGRTVAIKLMKPDLANDPSFEARFLYEAQASARMAHPTIVRVYDAGEDFSTDSLGNEVKHPYIIMEYVRGKLLRDVLHERRLSIEECVNYASGVLTALEFSHKAGVIHRDIKSANIMITETDQVKVMDFGIARAVSNSTATLPNTVGIMGTAQYFSPEQAKGETVDARTDLYSTGVLLYEMLAGRPPFTGDTAVSVAYQHVSEPVVAPSKYNEYITPELDQVVLHALAKTRDDRFQSAEDFRDHLIAAANGSPITLAAPNAQSEIPQSAPKTTLEDLTHEDTTDAFFDQLLAGADTAATTVMPEHRVEKHDSGENVVIPEAVQVDGDDLPSTDPFAKLGVNFSEPAVETSAIGKVGRPRAGLIWGVGSAGAVLLVGLIVWVFTLGSININIQPGNGGIAVPDVVNQTFENAYSAITGDKLLVIKQFQTSDTIPADTVISTDPAAGTKVPENTSITVFVSSGAQAVLVPSLLGMTETDATNALTALKLNLGIITQNQSATYPAGQVISSDPAANSQAAPGSTVNLVISNGKVMVPDVRNLSINDAKAQLTAPDVQLTVTITTKTTCTGTQGSIVLDQSIPAGLIAQKSAIILYVGCN